VAGNSEVLLKRFSLYLLINLFILLVFFFAALSIGAVSISFSDLLQILTGTFPPGGIEYPVILDIRLPRILLAIAVGGGLSVAGAVFQAIVLNPLAEPYILGVSSGGTFGVVLAFWLGLAFPIPQIMSFAGASVVILLVLFLSSRFGEIDPNRLLLTGVMAGAFFAAAILLLMNLMNDSLRNILFWLTGSLSLADRDAVRYIFPLCIAVSVILSLFSYQFNILSLGDDQAKSLGLNPRKLKITAYLLSSFLVGILVSVSGIIGFVGLIIPHVCRMIYGYDNRLVIPFSFFAGAVFLIAADLISRTILAPAEIPVGAVTAVFGAPVFIYLLRKNFNWF